MTDMVSDMVELRRNHKLGIPFGHPTLLDEESQHLRSQLLKEEVQEYFDAVENNDIVEIFDALIDIVVVAMGSALEMGLPWKQGWAEVQKSNMQKIRVDDKKKTKRGSSFDLVKPKDWEAPNLKELIDDPPYVDHSSILPCCGGVGEFGCGCTREELQDKIYNSLAYEFSGDEDELVCHNILQRASDIIFHRSEEDNRKYGAMNDNLDHAATIATIMQRKEINASDICVSLFALKIARHRETYKQDSLLDAVAYLGALDNLIQERGDDR